MNVAHVTIDREPNTQYTHVTLDGAHYRMTITRTVDAPTAYLIDGHWVQAGTTRITVESPVPVRDAP